VDFTKALKTVTYILRIHRQGEKDQVDFTEGLETVTYSLRVHRQGEKIRWTSQKHWKQSLTYWGCTDKKEKIRWTSWKRWKQSLTSWGCIDKEKKSGGLHRSTENNHLLAEDAQTRRKDQVNFTEALETVTYILRVHRQGGKNQVDFTKALKTVTYILRMHRQGEKITWTSWTHWEQSLTPWGYTDMEKRSGGLHRSIENSHLHTEGAQKRRKDQVNFTEALKTVTYSLRVHRQGGKDQVDFTEALKTVTYLLSVHRQREKIR
jgi:rRNA maturation protein Rpf1